MALEDQQGFGNGRCAWDLVAVLHATHNVTEYWSGQFGDFTWFATLMAQVCWLLHMRQSRVKFQQT